MGVSSRLPDEAVKPTAFAKSSLGRPLVDFDKDSKSRYSLKLTPRVNDKALSSRRSRPAAVSRNCRIVGVVWGATLYSFMHELYLIDQVLVSIFCAY